MKPRKVPIQDFRKLIHLICIAMLFLGFLYVTPLVTASGILVTPIGQTISALPNANFTLSSKMVFNEGADGYFSVTFYWDNNETAPQAEKWNFTYQKFVCRFTDGTPFAGSIGVSIRKDTPYGYPPGYYRYTISISEAYGESHDGDFWLNVTLRNAGLKSGVYYPHASGDQNVTISMARCYESSQTTEGPGGVIIRTPVTEFHDVAIIGVTPMGLPGFNSSIPGCNVAYAKWHPTWKYDFYIGVSVKNKGDFLESNVVVKLYNGSSLIGTSTIASLAAGAQRILNFSWVPVQNLTYPTRMKGYPWPYPTRSNIKANVTVVSGDVNATNNQLVWGTLTIRYPGDAGKAVLTASGWTYYPGDGKVYIEDLGLFGKWGWGADRSKTGSPKTKYETLGFWCDFSVDGKVSVEDLAVLGRTWGAKPIPGDGIY